MIDKNVLAITEQTIRSVFGSVDDLSHEIANTIANIYYKYFLITLESTVPSTHPLSDSEDGDILDELVLYGEYATSLSTALQTIPKMIIAIRELDPILQPNSRKAAEDFFLDIFKYDISNAHQKIGLRRMIERKFKKVHEIPGLIDLMDI